MQDLTKLNINCTDKFGNTALHTASYRDQKGVAVTLLQNGISTNAKNAKGKTFSLTFVPVILAEQRITFEKMTTVGPVICRDIGILDRIAESDI